MENLMFIISFVNIEIILDLKNNYFLSLLIKKGLT